MMFIKEPSGLSRVCLHKFLFITVFLCRKPDCQKKCVLFLKNMKVTKFQECYFSEACQLIAEDFIGKKLKKESAAFAGKSDIEPLSGGMGAA